MHKLFTSNDLILFAYHEMPADEAAEFCLEIAGSPETEEELFEIMEVKNKLDSCSFQPQPGVVQSILNYSNALEIKESMQLKGSFEVVLN